MGRHGIQDMQRPLTVRSTLQWASVIGILIATSASLFTSANSTRQESEREPSPELKVMAWNIWHGGREDGEAEGPKRVVDVIRDSEADIVAMQETYGSGELISEALGFHFHPRGTNVSIHSRYPIVEDVSVFEEFKCVGAIIELPNQTDIAFYSIWLPYDGEIWEAGTRDGKSREELLAACASSYRDLSSMLDQIEKRLTESEYHDVPIIIAGDFNSMSHLDYTEEAKNQYGGHVIDWPTSRVITDHGFLDAYREIHTEVDRRRDRTWTPRFPDQEQDRIDFVYYRGEGVRTTSAAMIDTHHEKFPSDHAAVMATLRFGSETKQSSKRK